VATKDLNKKVMESNNTSKQKPDHSEVGDETPDSTTQSYAEDNVIPNPDDTTKKRSILGNPKEFEEGNNEEQSDQSGKTAP
jgi:hypothetical protein